MIDPTTLVEQLIKPEIRGLKAYHVPESAGLIKLDAMENPYGWPELLREPLETLFHNIDVNRYPHPEAPLLQQALREAMAIPSELSMMLGNGSDELIQIVLTALAQPGRCIMSPAPSFVMYAMIASTLGLHFEPMPLQTHDFDLPLSTTLALIKRHAPAVIFLSYPNNPTGNRWSPDTVRAIIQAAPGLVIIDEAYYSYAAHSFMSEVTQYQNVLLMRTVSKLGLAGLRLGVMVGHPRWIEEFNKVRLPYNINVLTQRVAELALRHQHLFDKQVAAICAERARLFEALNQLPGIIAFPSETNFILFRVESGRAHEVWDGLLRSNILIKRFASTDPVLGHCLRVTVGTPQENDRFLDALRVML